MVVNMTTSKTFNGISEKQEWKFANHPKNKSPHQNTSLSCCPLRPQYPNNFKQPKCFTTQPLAGLQLCLSAHLHFHSRENKQGGASDWACSGMKKKKLLGQISHHLLLHQSNCYARGRSSRNYRGSSKRYIAETVSGTHLLGHRGCVIAADLPSHVLLLSGLHSQNNPW